MAEPQFSGLDEKISVRLTNTNAATLIRELGKQSTYSFIYSGEQLEKKQIKAVNFQSVALSTVLQQLEEREGFKFAVQAKTISVKLLHPLDGGNAVGGVQQSGRIVGHVTDANGAALSAASIHVIELDRNTQTDQEGNFSIDVPPGTYTVEARYVSFKTQREERIAVEAGQRAALRFVLSEEESELSEVVVTALGIKRAEKALGYASQQISGNSITNSMPTNWSSALAGKVAGLSVVTAGGPISTTRVKLRGDVSLNQRGNNALIILDGVPLSNTITNSGSAYAASGMNSVDYGNGFGDVNPEDIESIQVLKGAGATALYGTRAANGVIMITTKSGNQAEKGIGITFTSSTSMDRAFNHPDYQYDFGQGMTQSTGGPGSPFENQRYYDYNVMKIHVASYGAPFVPGARYIQYDPVTQAPGTEPTDWVAYKDSRLGIFQTGFTTSNTAAVNSKGDRGSLRASVTYDKNSWILPNTGFERLTATVSAAQKVSNYLDVNFRASYTNKDIPNSPLLGYSSSSVQYFLIFQNPSINLDWYRPKWYNGQEHLRQLQPFSQYPGNPFVTLYESTNASKRNSLISNLSATLQITPKTSLLLRSGIQFSNDEREQRRPISDVVKGNGYFSQQPVMEMETNSDALLTHRESFSNGLDMNLMAGGNLLYYRYNAQEAFIEGLVVPGIYKLSNGSSTPLVNSLIQEKGLNSLYGAANFSWKDKVFVDITARNDWSSTLPKANRSFFYPSINTSLLVHEMVQLPQTVSFLKVRGSLSQVGNDTEPYKTGKYYLISQFPGSATVPTTRANPGFKPEISTNYEAGLDLRLFNNRLGMDFSFYYNKTRNQIIDAPMDPTTGYTRATINAGVVRNRGYELVVNGTPIRTDRFVWNSTLNWSRNENRILELAEGLEENQVIGSVGSVSIIGKVGGTTGDLWGYKTVRNEHGDRLIDPDGRPTTATTIEYIGTAYPDWKAGLHNEFSYKGVTLGFLVDGQLGGIVYSQSHYKMMELGQLNESLNGRLPGTEYYIAGDDPRLAAAGLPPVGGVYMVAPGVVRNTDGSYSPNTNLVSIEAYNTREFRMANIESNSYSASFLKLREVRVEYNVPSRFLRKLPFNSLSVALYGRNLAIWSDFPMYDPEAAALNGGSILPGIETGQLPTPRTFGFNLRVSL
ncbi:SusC/RagA family TonB-linked outer membrane protein [Parapedobacter koreensis]|nr:SusC/RagA family TonB-linked outer membrane protein [Parapedobacter koreensis]